jgi:hypothetical protein
MVFRAAAGPVTVFTPTPLELLMTELRMCGVVLLSLLTTACAATMDVGAHVQRGLNVRQFRTYDWGPADALPASDPRLGDNPFFNDHLLGAVEKQMAAKGFSRAGTDRQADLLIHYHAAIGPRVDVNRIDNEYGDCFDEDCRVRVIEYEQGTLVIDIVDARTNRLIWRGWAQQAVDRLLGDDDRMSRQIDDAVQRMLAKFPGLL